LLVTEPRTGIDHERFPSRPVAVDGCLRDPGTTRYFIDAEASYAALAEQLEGRAQDGVL
jgi:hypothetical protein